VFDASMMQARAPLLLQLPSGPGELADQRSAITRRDGAAFLDNAWDRR
jgi:hypothetical protein